MGTRGESCAAIHAPCERVIPHATWVGNVAACLKRKVMQKLSAASSSLPPQLYLSLQHLNERTLLLPAHPLPMFQIKYLTKWSSKQVISQNSHQIKFSHKLVIKWSSLKKRSSAPGLLPYWRMCNSCSILGIFVFPPFFISSYHPLLTWFVFVTRTWLGSWLMRESSWLSRESTCHHVVENKKTAFFPWHSNQIEREPFVVSLHSVTASLNQHAIILAYMDGC